MPTYQEEDVTPEIAAKWLEAYNKMNRSIRWHKVAEYSEIMKAPGGWKLNGAGITLDTDGILVDGQHRLWGVVKSGITIRTLVTRDVSPGVRPTVDENIRRQFADDLTMNGIKNGHSNAALLRRILVWEVNGGLATLQKTTVGRPTLSARWPEFAFEITSTYKETSRWQQRFPGNKGSLHFMYWLLHYHLQYNPSTVDKFFQILTIGSQDPEDKVLLRCIDELRGEGLYRNERGQTGVPYQIYWMIRAWNAWMTGRKIAKLALPTGGLQDPYPELERAYVVK